MGGTNSVDSWTGDVLEQIRGGKPLGIYQYGKEIVISCSKVNRGWSSVFYRGSELNYNDPNNARTLKKGVFKISFVPVHEEVPGMLERRELSVVVKLETLNISKDIIKKHHTNTKDVKSVVSTLKAHYTLLQNEQGDSSLGKRPRPLSPLDEGSFMTQVTKLTTEEQKMINSIREVLTNAESFDKRYQLMKELIEFGFRGDDSEGNLSEELLASLGASPSVEVLKKSYVFLCCYDDKLTAEQRDNLLLLERTAGCIVLNTKSFLNDSESLVKYRSVFLSAMDDFKERGWGILSSINFSKIPIEGKAIIFVVMFMAESQSVNGKVENCLKKIIARTMMVNECILPIALLCADGRNKKEYSAFYKGNVSSKLKAKYSAATHGLHINIANEWVKKDEYNEVNMRNVEKMGKFIFDDGSEDFKLSNITPLQVLNYQPTERVERYMEYLDRLVKDADFGSFKVFLTIVIPMFSNYVAEMDKLFRGVKTISNLRLEGGVIPESLQIINEPIVFEEQTFNAYFVIRRMKETVVNQKLGVILNKLFISQFKKEKLDPSSSQIMIYKANVEWFGGGEGELIAMVKKKLGDNGVSVKCEVVEEEEEEEETGCLHVHLEVKTKEAIGVENLNEFCSVGIKFKKLRTREN